MAIYHFSTGIISRGKGGSAVQAAAYQARDYFTDDDGEDLSKDYRDRGGLLCPPFIIAAANAPSWVYDRQQLWAKAEAAEKKRADAHLARSIVMALPHELTMPQQRAVVKDFVEKMFLKTRRVVDVAMHKADRKGDHRNDHVHLLISLREIGPDGFSKTKDRSWTHTRQQLMMWRDCWAQACAAGLDRAGFAPEAERHRIAHLTLEEQRDINLEANNYDEAAELNRPATSHMGRAATAMKRNGQNPDRDGQAPNQKKFSDYAREDSDIVMADFLDGQRQAIERSSAVVQDLRPEAEQKLSREITALWKSTTTAQEFLQAVRDSGCALVRGKKRDFLVITADGEKYSLARLLRNPRRDASGKMRATIVTADIRERLDCLKAILPTMWSRQHIHDTAHRIERSSFHTILASPAQSPEIGRASSPAVAAVLTSLDEAGKGITKRMVPANSNKRPGRLSSGIAGPAVQRDITTSAAAQAAYDNIFSSIATEIAMVERDITLSPQDRDSKIAFLKEKQGRDATAAKQFILVQEQQRLAAAQLLRKSGKSRKRPAL